MYGIDPEETAEALERDPGHQGAADLIRQMAARIAELEAQAEGTGHGSARLLGCGLCYEEQGEEVHPHPECPVGRVAPDAERTATVLSQSIELSLTHQPDAKNKYGSGRIRPERVVFYYLDDRINAHLWGVWVREDGEVTDAPVDQLYRFDDAWPDWLTGLANAHDPREKPAIAWTPDALEAFWAAAKRANGAPATDPAAPELTAEEARASSAGVSPATGHRLSVQHADALWDAVAIPGPDTPTFTVQHQRVCKAVADILDEMTPAAVLPASVDRADVLREAADGFDRHAAQVLRAFAEHVDSLPGGEALRGEYWYREGRREATDMAREKAEQYEYEAEKRTKEGRR
jgi:hypothetical protein